ncbi:hypothetical protein GALMADRAFT_222652 [Galerina marginata CBS 339.88]|uniref:F-box domain-containing protein n=1 Tax=Galerina marginata (strain CBS 339.88) TaxID=685588 RepID=A0A067TD07_GALM3|nr:hypothetical protein GALMADRAFT_222652 [Galerina marginata CBS 339.88]
MLNPPLSFLSDDLLFYIVEHVSHLLYHIKNLSNLSLVDRAFTDLGQAYIFRTFQLGGGSGSLHAITLKLERLRKILDGKPSISNRVRVVDLVISHKKNAWLFEYRTLIDIFQRFADSPKPPHELHFGGVLQGTMRIQDPILVVERLVQSFFSQTLTVLHLTECKHVPLPLFLVCYRLREVLLDRVAVKEKTYEKFPDNLCSGRELPALEIFGYRASQSVVKQLINPPPRFPSGVPILDASSNTLEELYLTNLRFGDYEQLSLAGLVNLRDLSRLRVFALYAIIKCAYTVMSKIPTANNVTNLSFDFTVHSKYTFRGCLDEDWAGMCDEVIRISAGKPVELDVMIAVEWGKLYPQDFEQENLYQAIMKKMASLSEHANICTHFWNPTYWAQGLGPFPRGQVRGRCGK